MEHPIESDFATRAVHAGREDFAALGVHAPPLDLSSTYPTPDLDAAARSFDALVMGDEPQGSFVYQRLFNPTTDRFERGLATLEGAEDAAAFGSGMAALTATLLAAKSRGTHVVAVRPMYGTADHLLTSGLLGMTVTWTTQDAVGDAMQPDTGLVIIETPANPTLALVDIAHVVRQAGAVPVLVDSTFATPVLQRPLEQGAALVIHSATKFLGGHGDVLAGVVAGAHALVREIKHVRAATGGLLHPMGSYLLHRGLPTLAVRVERAQATAGVLAQQLAADARVAMVHYPSLPGQDPRGLLGTQMHGAGSVLSFELASDDPAILRAFVTALQLITPAVSLGSTDTLIQPPALLTHRVVQEAARRAAGIASGLLRLSVGLEDPRDLWRDLHQALEVVAVR
ncbi:MAG: PLP-dependent transferase [Gemmatimonadota bacterium]|nr:PLP-dependent transferase [Gemmatimonadota bacterium]MDQ8168404.1 PLP-dependent transferase [Gemmatimonadota bacterium]MDQ8173205.1 PLP-dependent transferase [Gemmatimonadota bacterium]